MKLSHNDLTSVHIRIIIEQGLIKTHERALWLWWLICKNKMSGYYDNYYDGCEKSEVCSSKDISLVLKNPLSGIVY